MLDSDPKLTVRLSALQKGLFQACGMMAATPAELHSAPDLPDWAQNICQQLRLTILKRFLDLKPQVNAVNWRDLGRLMGILQRLFTVMQGLNKDNCRAQFESVLVPSLPERLDSTREMVITSFGQALAFPAAIQNDFLAGLHEGYELLLDAEGQFSGDRGRNTLYFTLLAKWIEIEEMRQMKPRQSFEQLYQVLAPTLNDPDFLRYDWFLEVCKKIRLRMGTPGRPRKSTEK